MIRHVLHRIGSLSRSGQPRRGVIVVLTSVILTVLFAFLALSVDTGRVVLTETQMQNAVDAAALAASLEISATVHAAAQGTGVTDLSTSSAAVAAARQVAADVAAANGVFVDPDADVFFGRRMQGEGDWPIVWGGEPVNTVRVVARRTNEELSEPDGQVPLAFGWAIGRSSVPLTASATAYTESRDLVLVLDYSGSMNYDSLLNSGLGLSEAEALVDGIWDALVEADPKWPNTNDSKFPDAGFGQIDEPYGVKYTSSSNTSTIREWLGLNANDASGNRLHVFPQGGRYTSGPNTGLPRTKPTNSQSDALWNGYIDYVKNTSYLPSAYRDRYGYRTLMHYLQERPARSGLRPGDQSEDMHLTPHYPMQAVKDGASLFLQFLHDLEYEDEVGLVGYSGTPGTSAGGWIIDRLSNGWIEIDISDDPITNDYMAIDLLQRNHSADPMGGRGGQTAMGDGIKKAIQLLEEHTRFGASPTIVLMTDGKTNETPPDWSVPQDFNWADWTTGYNGNPSAVYNPPGNPTQIRHATYAFWQATEAIKRGIKIHTVAVGADRDHDLMRAIAFASGGVFVDVPGGTTIQEMEQQMLAAFAQIAAKLPPAKLIYGDE